jgi:hypothetical protein
VADHFERPRLIDVLGDVDDGRTDQWQAINVRSQKGAFFVNPNAVQTALREFFTRPLTNRLCVYEQNPVSNSVPQNNQDRLCTVPPAPRPKSFASTRTHHLEDQSLRPRP